MENEIETPSSPADTKIVVMINSIENLQQKPSFIKIVVEHNSVILGISPIITISTDENENTEIEYSITLPVSLENWQKIYDLVSTPILIKVIESLSQDANLTENELFPAEVKKIQKEKKKKKTNLLKSKNIIGMTSLDIQPIFLGEKIIREKLIVEAPGLSWNSSSVSWKNLPLLSVMVTQLGPDLFSTETEINYLNITIESIYNLPSSFTDSLEYACGTVIYIDSENPENVIFKNGKWKKFHDVENKKQWRTLSNLENRAKFSKYKINPEKVQSKKIKIDIQKIVNSDVPRVEWNYFNRNLMRQSGIQIMEQLIEKYKYWPFQILIRDKHFQTGEKEFENSSEKLYQCYVDLTELLYPGATRVCAIAQLFTHNISQLMQKTGLYGDIFSTDLQNELKEKDQKRENNLKSNSSSNQNLESSNCDENPNFALTNDKGEPTIILIEFELHQPLRKSNSTEDYSEEIAKLIKKTKPLRPYILTSHLAEEQFSDCVKNLVEIITERYQNFVVKNKRKEDKERRQIFTERGRNSRDDDNLKSECYHYLPDELECFVQHLHNAGEYIDIRNTLKNQIITLLDQKFTSGMQSWDTKESQNYIARAYVYLVERLHMILNSVIDNQSFTKTTESKESKNLYFHAEEAYLLGNIDDARYYYTAIISNNSEDPNAWINYAIFLTKISETEKAVQCCREAINLDSQHKMGLLMYGMLLTSLHKYRDAQLLLESLTVFHPLFAEGWVVLHLFYQQIEHHAGLETTITTAKKCFEDKTQNTDISLPFFNQPLAWSMSFCKETEVYIVTATLLMKLSLYEFAGLALAQELTFNGRSVPFLYYLSVHHFLQNQYKNAIYHLKEIESNYGLDYSTSSLIGHCFYKFGEFEDALVYYEYANATFNRPSDIHLVHLLMGSCYIHQENYNSAKKIFLNSCKISPTCETWLGLGIALYHLNELKESEMAFNEANQINSRNPIVWGYLCLLNISLQRFDEFSQCYRQAVKNNLKNSKLWQTITNAMEKVGYSSPIITTAAENIK